MPGFVLLRPTTATSIRFSQGPADRPVRSGVGSVGPGCVKLLRYVAWARR
jgi:hypothetical protein